MTVNGDLIPLPLLQFLYEFSTVVRFAVGEAQCTWPLTGFRSLPWFSRVRSTHLYPVYHARGCLGTNSFMKLESFTAVSGACTCQFSPCVPTLRKLTVLAAAIATPVMINRNSNSSSIADCANLQEPGSLILGVCKNM